MLVLPCGSSVITSVPDHQEVEIALTAIFSLFISPCKQSINGLVQLIFSYTGRHFHPNNLVNLRHNEDLNFF